MHALWPEIRSIFRQSKFLRPVLLAIYVPTLCALALLVFLRLKAGIHIAYLTGDPAYTMNAPFYLGLYSNIGILLWSSCAAICIFAAAVLPNAGRDRDLRLFILFSGILTAVLCLDDLFQIHDQIVPLYLRISENALPAAYVLGVGAGLFRFRRTIMMTDSLLLVQALFFFAVSVLFDLRPHGAPGHYLLEDGAKLIGLVSWFAYYAMVCWKALRTDARGARGDRG